jgi:hypothetical protein
MASIVPLLLTSQRHQRGVTAGEAVSSGQGTPPSRRVAHRHWHSTQQRGHPLEERFDGAGTGQMKEKALLVLFDLRGDFEEGQDNGRGLGLRQRGVLQRVGTPRMVEGIGCTRE